MSVNLTDEDFHRLRNFIAVQSGLNLDESKKSLLKDYLQKKIKIKKFSSFSEYFQYLHSHPDGLAEFKKLLRLTIVHETNFFRHPDQFQVFKEPVLKEMIDKTLRYKYKYQPSIAIWSAGCASGEEPYSIAMCIRDIINPHIPWNIEILGTDIIEEILEKARQAVYTEKSVRFMEQIYLNRYFEKTDKTFKLKKQIKNMVDFRHHNLIHFPYPLAKSGKWDIIFCRNVIIYFKKETVRQVISNFFDVLREGGYLFLGYSESLHGLFSDFLTVKTGNVFVYKKKKKEEFPTPVSEHQGLIRTPVPPQTENPTALYNKILKLLRRGNVNNAMDIVQRYIKLYPNDARGYLLLGRLHLDKGIVEQALAALHKATEINRLLAPAYYFLGIAYEKKKLMPAAIQQYKKTLYIDQKFILARFNLALIHHGEGRRDDAIKEYKNVLKSLYNMPPNEILEFTGGFTVKAVMETCQRNIGRLLFKEKSNEAV